MTMVTLPYGHALSVTAKRSIASAKVTVVSDQLIFERGNPKVICIKLDFIRPGKPIENCFVERFNGKFRDECLNQHWLVSLSEARRVIEAWRLDYNRVRPHSSLGNVPPAEFAEGAALRSATPTSTPPNNPVTMLGLTS